MLTYQLQNRIYKVHDDTPFNFPNDVEIQIIFEPLEPFGAATGYCRTAVKGHKASSLFNANTGRWTIQSNPPLEPINFVLEYDNMRFELQSNKAIALTRCNNIRELDDLITSFHYGLPILMNVEILDSPTIKQTLGKVGEVSFNWEIKEQNFHIETTTQEIQQKRIISAFERMSLFAGNTNRRLLAATYYFHIACRLLAVGNSPWEFMAEVILNLCKVLQILFGEKRDDVRAGLIKLGYSQNEIECAFIPIMILRGEFDVGHVTLELFKPEHLNILYDYLVDVEFKFRELLRNILERVNKGTSQVRQDGDLLPDEKRKKEILKLIDNIGKRDGLKKH